MYQNNSDSSDIQNQDLYIDLDCENEQVPENAEGNGLFGPITCGVIFGYFLISNGTKFPLMIFGLALVCYTAIRILTREPKSNLVAIPATFLSAALTAGVGYFLYAMLG